MVFLLNRIGQAVIVLIGVITLIFFVLRLVPGDPVSVIAPSATAEAKEQIRFELGLDQPLATQYIGFIGDITRGDFGESYFFQGQAIDLVLNALPFTAMLAGCALLLALLVAVPLGIVSAVFADRWPDRVILGICLIMQSSPNFWIALLLLSVVAVNSGIFPTVGFVGPMSLVLPSLTLSISLIAVLAQVVRVSLFEVLRTDMVTAMQARGIAPRRIVLVHGMRHVSVPLLTVVGAQFGYLLGGAVIIEYIFNYPGLGLLTLNAVLRRDYPLLQIITLVTSLIFLLINLLIDLSYGLIDSRLSVSERAGGSRLLLLRGRLATKKSGTDASE